MSDQLPKLTLTERPTPCMLLYDTPKELDTKFGKSYLYNFSVGGNTMVYFASPKTHEKIQETGAVTNDEILLSKTTLETGKSWIVVDRKGGSKPRPQHATPPSVDPGDRQDIIDASFFLGRATEIWCELHRYAPDMYKYADIRDELLTIAITLERTRNLFMKHYQGKEMAVHQREPKQETDEERINNLPF